MGSDTDMFRSNRIKQIAEANQNVFSSNSEAQWWLAEPAPKSEPAKAAASARPIEPSAARPLTPESVARREAPAPDPQYVPLIELNQAPSNEETPTAASASTFDDDLVWDAKAGCFMRVAVPVAR